MLSDSCETWTLAFIFGDIFALDILHYFLNRQDLPKEEIFKHGPGQTIPIYKISYTFFLNIILS